MTTNKANVPALFFVNVALSLTGFIVCFLLSKTDKMEETTWVFIAGIVICFILFPIFLFFIMKQFGSNMSEYNPKQKIKRPPVKNTQGDYFLYVFSIFAFTAIVDLAIAFTLDGYTTMVEFYLENGEEYLKSSYGCFINYWDGTFHYLCYLILIYLILQRNKTDGKYQFFGWLWFGSIYNSIIVFLPGNLLGPWYKDIHLSYLLNIPYIVFPVLFALHLISQGSGASEPATKIRSPSRSQGAFSFLYDLFLILFGFGLITLFFVRAFVVLHGKYEFLTEWGKVYEPHLLSNTVWPALQVFVYLYYFSPVIIFISYSLYTREFYPNIQKPLILIAFGSSLQGQFSYIGPALHPLVKYPDPTFVPIPVEGIFLVSFQLFTI